MLTQGSADPAVAGGEKSRRLIGMLFTRLIDETYRSAARRFLHLWRRLDSAGLAPHGAGFDSSPVRRPAADRRNNDA